MSTPNDLFPVPSPQNSKYVPTQWAATTPESTATLLKILKDNHERWHIFFNDRGFHNHSAHRALALWALGADDSIIQGGYDRDSSFQVPALVPPGPITANNFNDYLGDGPYYGAYLAFFTNLIEQKGVAAVIEEFVFSERANFAVEGSGKPHPQMLARFLGSVIHPLIHTGYGLEFGLPGMVAEGLAEAAVHAIDAATPIPASFFETSITPPADKAASDLKSNNAKRGIHTFTLLARILNDPELGTMVNASVGVVAKTMKKFSDTLTKYMDDWHVDATDPQHVTRKLEEIIWASVVIYGVGGWKVGQEFNADFFYMHIVTSSLFISSYIAHLSPTSQELLLKSYLLASINIWISRGRAELDIKGFYELTSAYPTPSGPLPTPNKETIPSSSSSMAITPNPWLPLIETTLVHPNDHLVKIQRALAHYGSLFGTRVAGLADFNGTELPHADILDGSLFIRVAGLTAQRMGRVREGDEVGLWDRSGFYKS